MYQAWYRKWRPLTFSDVTGQEHIVQTLRSQVESQRLSHAYLFTGTRGTGKTTCAKILSRAANCLSPKNGDPCNVCASCTGILDGSILDVIEIDAASNSGVDNIRSLRDELIYSPVEVKFRVYIIDEVHMLSAGAFNALLKTLEEPPPHVLFILATTETHKVPATILSRCQRFAFRRISPEGIAARLWQITSAEGINISRSALSLISRLSDGSLRDAISLTDQCAAASNGNDIDETLALEVLGLSGTTEMAQWLEEIDRHDGAAALARLDRLYLSGRDITGLLDELAVFLRDLMMCHMLSGTESLRLDDDTADKILSAWSLDRLLDALRIISETQAHLSRGFNKRLEVEMCILKLCGAFDRKVEPQTVISPQIIPEPKPRIEPVTIPQHNDPPVTIISQSVSHIQESDNNLKSDPRYRKLLAIDPFCQTFIEAAEPELSGEKLRIKTKDHFAAGLLRQDDFMKKALELYPGGVEILCDMLPPDDKGARLSALRERAGDLFVQD